MWVCVGLMWLSGCDLPGLAPKTPEVFRGLPVEEMQAQVAGADAIAQRMHTLCAGGDKQACYVLADA